LAPALVFSLSATAAAPAPATVFDKCVDILS
jgi:hypothetical protein